MEWKNLGAITAVMLLLVSPMAFAREGESGGGSGVAPVPASACPTDSTIKVKCDGTQTAREWKDAYGCKYECAEAGEDGTICPMPANVVCQDGTEAYKYLDENGCVQVGCINAGTICPQPANVVCQGGTEAYKYYDENGCVLVGCRNINPCPEPANVVCQGGTEAYKYLDDRGCVYVGCRQISGNSYVHVTIIAEPREANVGDTIKVVGTIAYEDNSPSVAAVPAEKKFKVEIKMTGMDGSLSSRDSGTILFESSDDGSQKPGRGSDDFISATVRAVASVFGSTDDGTRQEDRNLQDGSSGGSQGGSGSSPSAGVVAAVDANSGSASQERTDYIVLKSGEKQEVAAYFAARTPGMKIVEMEVYESAGFDCPTTTDPATTAAPPCGENFRKVAEASTKVKVSGEITPPPPPPGNEVASGVIQMSSGWNMVSVPAMAKVDMQRIQKECGSQEFAWRLTPDGYMKERTLVPGYGYWVKAGNDCKLEVGADSYTTELAGLFSGWNLVGAPGQEVQVASFRGNCDITAGPWHYSNPGTATAANPYVLSSTLSPGKAYWIKVPSSCSLGTTEEQPPVPPS